MRFFRSLRGKLILTYTTVTVLALLALEILVMVLILIPIITGLTLGGNQEYISDIVYTIFPQARTYLQPGEEDLSLLQDWLGQVYESGYASLEPQGLLDSPAAEIVKEEPMYVLSPDGTVIAQAPADNNNLVGRQYTPPNIPGSQQILENAFNKMVDPDLISARTPSGDILVAVPVFQEREASELVGVIVLTVEPSPPVMLAYWPLILGSILLTGFILLLAVSPFGALFGFIMSHGLTRRLTALTRAADAWSEGNFSYQPEDRSQDEIGYLGRRMRNMAERIQSLLQSQRDLALLEERNRLARELHDTVKQQTFATLMQVRAAKNILDRDPAGARQHLEEAENLIKTSQQELGLVISELRPAVLEGQGLARALEKYLESWSQHTCIPPSVRIRNERSLPLPIEQALYRIAQEALANVARHSRASEVQVHLVYEVDSVQLDIIDNGVGFDSHAPEKMGVGLQSMRERAAAAGGRVVIESKINVGTAVRASIPIIGKE